MKAIVPCLAAISLLSFIVPAKAQTIATLQAPPQNIAIDGSVKEWGDSLRYYNAEKHINYALANDKDNLYMAVRINDRSEQTRILKAGITLSINTKGKKKETYSITFPLNPNGTAPTFNMRQDDNPDVTDQDRNDLMEAMLTTLRGIKVEGFTDIEGNMITISNTYGIQTAVKYDNKGYLICEAEIPLKLLHADNSSKNEWAFNLKINGITRPTPSQGEGQDSGGGHGGRGGGGRGGHGGGGGRGGRGGAGGTNSTEHSELFKSEDFWEKYYLAK